MAIRKESIGGPAENMIQAAHAAKMLGIDTVAGFTGSSIWQWLYSFPPVTDEMVNEGYADFARRFIPILDEYQKLGVRFALEVHPTEIAFDTYSTRKALEAIDYHPAFGFNYDPSHLGYQGVDYVDFINQFADRIFHVHMKECIGVIPRNRSACSVAILLLAMPSFLEFP